MNFRKTILSISTLALFCTPAILSASEELNTDWLEAKIGSSGEALNSEVINVEQVGDTMIIDVQIPADNLQNYETITVIGKKSNKPVKMSKEPELLNNYNDAYGIRFQIKRLPGFEFRLRLADESEQTLK